MKGAAIDKKFYDDHRNKVIEYIAEHDDELIDKYLNGDTLTLEEMRKSIRKSTLSLRRLFRCWLARRSRTRAFSRCLTPDGRGLLVQYEDASSVRSGRLCVLPRRAVPRHHQRYFQLRRCRRLPHRWQDPRHRTEQGFFTFYMLPAAGTGATPPAPTIPEQQKGFMFFA